jgi:hypothetical protein
MDTILEVVQKVTAFVLVFSVLSNLFARTKYVSYFRFVEGLILILLVLSPLFSWLTGEQVLTDYLQENILESEASFSEEELLSIEEKREEMLKNEWKQEGENTDVGE